MKIYNIQINKDKGQRLWNIQICYKAILIKTSSETSKEKSWKFKSHWNTLFNDDGIPTQQRKDDIILKNDAGPNWIAIWKKNKI